MIVPRFVLAATLATAASCAVVPSEDHVSLSRRAANGIKDPGFYPGGKDTYKTGWKELPPVEGATIDNSTFKFGKHKAQLTAYMTENIDKSKIKRAVIALHGDYRDAWNQFKFVNLSLQNAIKDGDVKNDEVAIVAPMFFSQKDNGAYPADKDGVSTSKALIWDTTTWGNGDDAIYPSFMKNGKLNNTEYKDLDGTYHDAKSKSKSEKKSSKKSKSTGSSEKKRRGVNVKNGSQSQRQGPDVSPFDVIDTLIAYFLDKKQFPNLGTVVVSGFSLGAQLNQRYIALRKDPSDTRINFGVSSPGSFVYFTKDRVTDTSKCKGFNDYKYGLEGELPRYVKRNNVPSDPDSVMKRYFNATTYYMVGAQDDAKGDPSCEAQAQGNDHVQKVSNWVRKILPKLDIEKYDSAGVTKDGIPKNTYFTTIEGVAHQAYGIYLTAQGAQMLFIDDYFKQGENAKGPRPLKGGAANADKQTNKGKDQEGSSSHVAASVSMTTLMVALTMIAIL